MLESKTVTYKDLIKKYEVPPVEGESWLKSQERARLLAHVHISSWLRAAADHIDKKNVFDPSIMDVEVPERPPGKIGTESVMETIRIDFSHPWGG